MTIETFGGRKNIIMLFAMALLGCANLLGISEATQQQIVTLAIGGAGVIALEKTGVAVATRKAKLPPPAVPPPPAAPPAT